MKEEIARLYAALKKLKEELILHGEAIEDIIRFLTEREENHVEASLASPEVNESYATGQASLAPTENNNQSGGQHG